MLTKRQATTLLQIFCELSLYSQIIFISMEVADYIYEGKSECEWVKVSFRLRNIDIVLYHNNFKGANFYSV